MTFVVFKARQPTKKKKRREIENKILGRQPHKKQNRLEVEKKKENMSLKPDVSRIFFRWLRWPWIATFDGFNTITGIFSYPTPTQTKVVFFFSQIRFGETCGAH